MFQIGLNKNLFTVLAPMQDVTNYMFMELFEVLGEPDLYVTEFLRVNDESKIDSKILNVIEKKTSKRPIIVQLLGCDSKHLVRIAKTLQDFNICAIDLNCGCPMPKIHKKGVGGGLLAELDVLDNILYSLKSEISLPITVKSRIGFEDDNNFTSILKIYAQNDIDCLFLHGRTVKGLYRSKVDYNKIKQAKEIMKCPVIANGDIMSYSQSLDVIKQTNADGVMIGRSAIRNIWIFRQIREQLNNEKIFQPKLSDVFNLIDLLSSKMLSEHSTELRHVSYMKKFANFIGQCVDEHGKFLHAMRLSKTISEFYKICELYMLNDNADRIYTGVPFDGVVARPNCE